MVSFEKQDKKLVVPSALGNFGNAGGGSGSGMTPAEVQELIDASIETYDTEVQVDLEDIRENVSGNTDDIAELSASTVSLEQRVDAISLSGITSEISALSGTVSTLESGLDTLSGTTGNISSNVNTLSAATDNIRTNVENLSGATGAISGGLAALSGSVETLSASTASGLQTAENAASSAYTRADAAYALAEGLSFSVDISSVADAGEDWGEEDLAAAQRMVDYLSGKTIEEVGYVYVNDMTAGDRYVLTWIDVAGEVASFDCLNKTLFLNLLNVTGSTYEEAEPSGGGGIEKVDTLPETAEEGDMVWLEGAVRTGYTILCVEDAVNEAWPWELDMQFFSVDGDEPRARFNGNIGRWVNFGDWTDGYSDILVRPRLSSGDMLLDVIDTSGEHTIGAGTNAVSITSNVDFPSKGCLYVYSGGKWYSKPTFEWVYDQSEALALLDKIRAGVEDFDLDNFVLRYTFNNVSREFKATVSAYYGVDFQASDDRGTKNGDWGRLSILNYRLDNEGNFVDIVGEHWIVSSDQIDMPRTEIIHIDSAGTITSTDGFNLLPNMYRVSTRIEFECELDDKYSAAPLKWFYRQYEEVDGDTKLMYYLCVEIPIEGVVYKGIWKTAEHEWTEGMTPLSWVQV